MERKMQIYEQLESHGVGAEQLKRVQWRNVETLKLSHPGQKQEPRIAYELVVGFFWFLQ